MHIFLIVVLKKQNPIKNIYAEKLHYNIYIYIYMLIRKKDMRKDKTFKRDGKCDALGPSSDRYLTRDLSESK